MIELGLLLLVGLAVCTVLVVATAVKAVLWVVLLPVRLVFWTIGGIILLPLLLFKFLFGGIILLLALPIIAISLLAAFAAIVAGLLLPLLPIVLLVALVWYLVRPAPTALVRS